MFISKRDAFMCALSVGISYCVGKITDEDYEKVIQSSDSKTEYDSKIELLNNVDKLRAVHVSDELSVDFLENKTWFKETVQADKSCAVLYSETEAEAAVILFYDKECNFYIIDYVDEDNVPFGALIRDTLLSNTTCIAYANEIPDSYARAIILQGKED